MIFIKGSTLLRYGVRERRRSYVSNTEGGKVQGTGGGVSEIKPLFT